jgi:hypothetical protein
LFDPNSVGTMTWLAVSLLAGVIGGALGAVLVLRQRDKVRSQEPDLRMGGGSDSRP